jgi:hypothetical protein
MIANRIGQITGLLRRTNDAMRPTSRARRPTRRFSISSGIEGLEERLVLNGTLPTTTAPTVQTEKVLVYSVTSPTSSSTVPVYGSTTPKNPPISTGTSGSTILLTKR